MHWPRYTWGPASDCAIAVARKVSKEVFLRSDEEKGQLVHLCIANFHDFVSGKKSFWYKNYLLYQNLHPDSVALNVKGYM